MKRFHVFNKIVARLRNPSIPFIGYIKVFFSAIKRLIDVAVMMFLVHVWPEQTYRFSTRKCLPPKSVRFNKSDRSDIPFKLIESRTSDIPKMKEVNVVLRGSSFDLEKLEELDSPIFLLSFWEPIQTKKDVTYAIGRAKGALRFAKLGYKTIYLEGNSIDCNGNISPNDINRGGLWYEQFIDDGICKRISLVENVYRSPKPPLWPPTNSGLPGICALSYFAEKVNVYGWDYYLESSPDCMSYWQLYSHLYKLKTDISLTKTHLESTMINYYYGYHLSKLPNVNIYGRLGQLGKHEKLIGKIERALFNS